jgi:hypothetical protein
MSVFYIAILLHEASYLAFYSLSIAGCQSRESLKTVCRVHRTFVKRFWHNSTPRRLFILLGPFSSVGDFIYGIG